MGRKRQLSDNEQGQIKAFLGLKLSKRSIARKLCRSVHAVTSYLNDTNNYGRKYKGKRPALTPKDTRRLIRKASNSTLSAAQLKSSLDLGASRWTITRALKAGKLRWTKMLKKPLLTRNHKANRLEFCRSNMSQNWRSVWFCDEKKFNLDGPDCTAHYWHDPRKDPLIRPSRQMGGGGVMVWLAFTADKKSSLCFLKPNMNSDSYQGLLYFHLLPYYSSGELLLQDNAPPHVANSTRQWLNDFSVSQLPFPPRSPDLNPVENLWSMLSRHIYHNGRHFDTVTRLREAILAAWNNISQQVLEGLACSMPDRIFQCITAKGGYTKY